MGFISSGTSTTDIKLDIHLTNYGRGLVITGNVYSEISKFINEKIKDRSHQLRLNSNS